MDMQGKAANRTLTAGQERRRRAGIYVRLSRVTTKAEIARGRREDVSPTVQQRRCRELCEQRGWDVVEVYDEDLGKSGFTGVERAGFDRMLADVRSGHIDAVVVFKLDRLGRRLRGFLDFTDVLDAHDAVFASVHDPIDTSTPIGRAVLNILAVFAQLESEIIKLRMEGANAERAAQGQPHRGGVRPFGFDRDRKTAVPAEQDRLREAVDRFLDGESLRSICADWTRQGVVTPKGNPWASSTLSTTLRNPRLAGYRTHTTNGTTKLYDAEWDPVIPRDRWEELQTALADSKRKHKRLGVHRYLLTGIAVCGLCETPLMSFGHDTRTAKPRYACRKDQGLRGCGGVSILQAETDAVVAEMLLAVVDVDRARAALSGHDAAEHRARLQTDLEAVDLRLAQLSQDYYTDGVISRTEWLANREPLTAKVAQLRRRIDALPPPSATVIPPDVVDLHAWWHADTTTLEDRRTLLSAAVRRVKIKPVRRRGYNQYDPDRVEPPEWRF